MKAKVNVSPKNEYSIKDIFFDKKEHSIRRSVEDGIEKARSSRKEESSEKKVSFEEKVLLGI